MRKILSEHFCAAAFNQSVCHPRFRSKMTAIRRGYFLQTAHCRNWLQDGPQEKYLGDLLSHDMSSSWTHGGPISTRSSPKKAHQKLGFIRRNLRGSPQECKKFGFLALVHSEPGLGSNTFYQIQIQIQIQKFGFFKYKYKYKYFVQLWFKYKYKYKYIDTNTNTNTFNQIYLPKLVRIQNRAIL